MRLYHSNIMTEYNMNDLNIRFRDVWPYVVHKSKSGYDIYIGRPSKYGNPFSHQDGTLAKYKVNSREEAVFKYKEWVMQQSELIDDIRKNLHHKVLGCYCSPLLCHGHVLAAIANNLFYE